MYGDEYSSWIEIRNENETESNYSGGNRKYLTWYEDSKYGGTNKYSEDFNKIYVDLGEYGIQNGQYAEIHLKFKVAKDANDNITLDSENGKQNMAEVNAYRSEQNGKTAGLIDIDSKPGNLDPRTTTNYQDDEDMAPYYKLQLGYSNGNTGGSSASGGNDQGGEGGQQGGTGGDNGKVETDQNGNVVGYGNTIEGNVWEDIKTITIEEDNRNISNGIKETEEPENEPLIDHVKVELIEIIGDKEIIIDTVRTGKQLLLTSENKDNAQSTGAYRFSGLTSGKYQIRFTYGDEEHLKYQLDKEGNLLYNGQDYQGVSSEKIINTDKTNAQLAQSYEDTEIMLVIDNSNSMSGEKMLNAKQEVQSLLTSLQNNLPGVKIGLVNFNEVASTIGKVGAQESTLESGISTLTAGGETAIARGIIEAMQGYAEGKNKLMILITDGQETVETEEKVIEQIENLRAQGIKLTTILTGNSETIFGTEAKPRYGTVNKLDNITADEIYEIIIKETTIEADRSLGKDVEADRRQQIDRYSVMDYEKGKELDIEGMVKLKGEEREKAITTLAENTTMRAETKVIEFTANNVGTDKIHEVNQALIRRPKAELRLTEEISTIKVTLSDGTVIIDTAKGLSKNVLGLGVEGLNTVSIYLDEELMQGATVEVTYRVMVENIGEVDRLSNYFEGESDATITTTANVVYAYINKSVVYRADGQPINPETGEPYWEPAEEGQDGLPAGVVGGTNITIRTAAFEKMYLYPVGSKEVKNGEGICRTEVIPEVILSKVISPENDDTSSLTYECLMEIAVRGNEVGRRVLGAIPGNLGTKINSTEDGTHIELENEEADSQKIIVTKPLGADRSGKTTLIALATFATIAVIALCLRKPQKHNSKK